MNKEDEPFDIRKQVSNPDDPDPGVQRGYDRINGMVFLCEGITFGQLYGEPLVKSTAVISPRIPEAVKRGYFPGGHGYPGSPIHDYLTKTKCNISIRDLMMKPIEEHPKDLVELVRALGKAGIFVPVLPVSGMNSTARRYAFKLFLAEAGHYTVRDLYTLDKKDQRFASVYAVHLASKYRILGDCPKNNQVCQNVNGVPTCVSKMDHNCSSGQLECSMISDFDARVFLPTIPPEEFEIPFADVRIEQTPAGVDAPTPTGVL